MSCSASFFFPVGAFIVWKNVTKIPVFGPFFFNVACPMTCDPRAWCVLVKGIQARQWRKSDSSRANRQPFPRFVNPFVNVFVTFWLAGGQEKQKNSIALACLTGTLTEKKPGCFRSKKHPPFLRFFRQKFGKKYFSLVFRRCFGVISWNNH